MGFTVTLRLDWTLMREQKLALIEAAEQWGHPLDGLLEMIDYIQDRAAEQGEPVQWLEEKEDSKDASTGSV